MHPNILVSLAYIKTNKNPLSVFCNYILYALSISTNKMLRADELKTKLIDCFGLDMPYQIINNCIRLLKKNGEVIQLPNGGGYSIGKTEFNVDTLEKTMLRLHEQEKCVLQSIVNYVAQQYKLSWSLDNAQTYLSTFLGEEENGARLFLFDEIPSTENRVSPSWYIAKFVNCIQKKPDSLEKKYLEEIVNGMMIYQGIYQAGDYQQNREQKFKGTVFYLDTKLVLRALGFSWDAQVKATQELIDLITRRYDGRIGIFQQTLREVENALSRAGFCYCNKKPILDTELRIYSELNPVGASLLQEVSTTVLERLKRDFGVEDPISFDWTDPEVKRYSIEVSKIIEYIISERDWRHGAVTYDVEIINQINILRKGNYSVRYGGKLKLPVFLTTNTDLVYTFRKYTSEQSEIDGIKYWNNHALPVISDNMLLFRLWVPYAGEYSNLPALTLSRFAYAAQNPNTQYFEKLREMAASYRDEKGIELINLSEIRRQQLEDILVANTKGDADLLSEEMVALSIEELIKMESISLQSQITDLKESLSNQEDEIAKNNLHIIELAAKPFVDKIGAWRILIWFSKIWWIVPIVLFAVGAKAVEVYVGIKLPELWFIILIPGLFTAVLTIIDKVFEKKNLTYYAEKWAITLTWKKYSKKVLSKLGKDDLVFRHEILQYCLDNTPLFCKNKNFCPL